MNFKEFFLQSIKESIGSDALSMEIKNFLDALARYQSNNNSPEEYAMQLFQAYQLLSHDMKKQIAPSKLKYKNMFRGADSKSTKAVISFTWNQDAHVAGNNALFYGANQYSFIRDIQSHKGLIDTAKLPEYFGSYLWRKITNQYSIGDDENEILVLAPVFKQ